MNQKENSGKVIFIGAGPGSPDLITRKGWRLLSQADIVFYDALLDVKAFQEAAPHARWVNVGKRANRISTPQSFINKSLVNFALRGYCVARLKGGDPSVFGRLSEELEACQRAEIYTEIIPGVTAASSSAAELGISLTKRNVSRSVTFLTPRLSHGAQSRSDHWLASALESDTVVFYMAAQDMLQVSRTLINRGKDPNTPLAFIESAGSAHARKRISNLATCAEKSFDNYDGPITIIMGDVVDYSLDFDQTFSIGEQVMQVS